MTPASHIAVVMRVLADPTRRTVFEQIAEAGELTVGALTERNDVSQPAISQHVRALKEAGLLGERRDGRLIHYRCEPRGLAPLVDWLGYYGVFWRIGRRRATSSSRTCCPILRRRCGRR